MWSIANRTPYSVQKSWDRDKDGVHEWIVAVKGTFNVNQDGRVVLADEQLDPLLLPKYDGESGISSLQYEADLVSTKPTTDVILNGTAYAPKGRPSTEFLISLRLDRIHKEIKAIGHRIWERSMFRASSSPEHVTEIPIVYERAYGGFDQSNPDPTKQRLDTRNPVGCGLTAQAGQPLPNFEYPGKNMEKAGPAGFGALASHWSPRRELSGTYDEAWQHGRYPLLPKDWDPRSLLCSPADQRPESYLQGGERVELINLTPNGVLHFVLPKIRLTFHTIFNTGLRKRSIGHDGHLASVILEPDYHRVILVWSSTLPCRRDGDYLRKPSCVRSRSSNDSFDTHCCQWRTNPAGSAGSAECGGSKGWNQPHSRVFTLK